ncbi:MAG TPA: hypothetical protein VFV02_14530 [Acidimicrobiales bacterium]|nr:hypothetical protein [Acidimicrobiales bacterium]
MLEDLIEDYLRLGLALGRHIDGLVDAYYGPREYADAAAAAPPEPPAVLADRARRLIGALAVDRDLDSSRRTWLTAQVRGLHTTARKLSGEPIGYLDEIEECYGVKVDLVPEEVFSEGHKRLDEVLPGDGNLAERYIAWREKQAVAPDVLGTAVQSLAEDFRERTDRSFGLPVGERVEFELVNDKPWSGFNYYLGGLRSRVAINTDLPVLSTQLGPLVAHEAYPGHHTEHSRKEAGLVRRRSQLEETIFLVGTPQCLLAEGLADLGIEVIAGRRPEPVIAEHLEPLRVPYDADLVGQLSVAGEALGGVRGNAAILIHDRGMDPDDAVAYMSRWSLLPRPRAEKAVQFLVDPTWRAYAFCYIEGLRLCRAYVSGDPARFERLVTEQIVPSDLAAA